jgi:hypothetical protein
VRDIALAVARMICRRRQYNAGLAEEKIVFVGEKWESLDITAAGGVAQEVAEDVMLTADKITIKIKISLPLSACGLCGANRRVNLDDRTFPSKCTV